MTIQHYPETGEIQEYIELAWCSDYTQHIEQRRYKVFDGERWVFDIACRSIAARLADKYKAAPALITGWTLGDSKGQLFQGQY